ncbi:MAG: YceI family protein [Deltaproteobacteria bacterium]|nr:YceI family protein [Deltaproteobacteria bacterium]
MKGSCSSLFLWGALAASTALAAPSEWSLDPGHSSIAFQARFLMASNVHGIFREMKGSLRFDDQDVTKSYVDVTIPAASIDTGLAKRDEHLRSPDFLDVARFPVLTFRSKRIKELPGGRLDVVGDLTIHGITREATLHVNEVSNRLKDPWGGIRMGASAHTSINRGDFGLKWNKVVETGGFLVGEKVDMVLDIMWVRDAKMFPKR